MGADLPTFIPLSEAARRFRLGRKALTRLVKSGRIRAVSVNGGVVVAEEDVRVARIEAAVRARAEADQKLRGQPIRATEAARRYRIPERTIGRWAESGYIRVMDRGPKLLLLDEADVKLAAEIFRRAREATGSSVRAGWVLKRTLEALRG